ncbi:N-carbamoyl-L-amino-acid hydrolase [Neorhizobium galegae]|uniref:hydantoinase/carbamoylase family amidase n=1 Tax=Neorhizobium galegae TaxID=399 RepID=UPI00277E6A62|nr:hydantoinase/carbamoylase family amidase [Neorhizobium galegae]MDQ0133896.1 N-carbamoyl-L-amino-acid hydrolase [Neorhizobium galegae]
MTALASISPERLWSRLMELGRDGALPEKGVNRQALSAEEILSWRRIIAWGAEAGLTPSTDPAGNLFLTLQGKFPHLSPVVAGSHADSQPTGGLFDGAFGTLAALEAVTAIAEAGLVPERPITVVAWMNEEGSRFAPGMMGSELFAGKRTLEEVMAVKDATGVSVAEALANVHAAFPEIERRPLGFPVHAYIEPHIEQADVLESAGAVIGVVSGIQGKKTYEFVISGREAHAGTEPMERRQDALQAFARMAVRMQQEMVVDNVVKFTIGRLEIQPNAPSVVPSRAVFRVDLRHPDNAMLDRLGLRLETIAAEEVHPCGLHIKRLVDAPSNTFDEGLRTAIWRSAARYGYPALDVLSAAGHDARQMAPLAPSVMIFIPCRGGLSHHPDEWAEPEHVAAGAAVLLDLLLEQAGLSHNHGDTS